MTEASRRNFLTIAGAGVAAVGVAAAAPLAGRGVAGGAVSSVVPESLSLPAGASGAIAAFVHDVHKGEVAVMVEGREVVITDHALVARLAHAIAVAGR